MSREYLLFVEPVPPEEIFKYHLTDFLNFHSFPFPVVERKISRKREYWEEGCVINKHI